MTELHSLYETAIQIIEKTISLGMSDEAIESTSVSALLTDKGSIYTGINGNRLENNVLTKTCSEYEAITAMMMSGENRIIGIVSVSFKNRQVIVPCEKCRELICRINPQNVTCGVMTDENTALSLQMLINQSIEKINNKVSNGEMNWNTEAEFWGNDETDNTMSSFSNVQNNNNQHMMNNQNQFATNGQQMFFNNGMMNNQGMMMNNPNMMNNQGMMMNNPNMMMGNPNMMNNQPFYYNNNPYNQPYNNNMGGNFNNMNNGYYQQNMTNQNPYDYVQPVPPSSIQRNAAIDKYSNVSGNIYVHSTVNSQSTPSGNTPSQNTLDNSNSIYKQKLKDLLNADTDVSDGDDEGFYDDADDDNVKRMAKMDAKYTKKAAKKLAKANKKATKKSIFDKFI